MNAKKIAEKYDSYLRNYVNEAVEWKNYESNQGSREDQLKHCRWMCQQIMGMEDNEKAIRWICFIQGQLFAHTAYVIKVMRDDNRPSVADRLVSGLEQFADSLEKPKIRLCVFKMTGPETSQCSEDRGDTVKKFDKPVDDAAVDFMNEVGRESIVAVTSEGAYIAVYYWR